MPGLAWAESPLPRLAGFNGEPRAALNVEPMTSVVLVLLIIFMVVMPGVAVCVKMPKAVHSIVMPHSGITVGVDDRGAYYLDDRPVADAEFPAALRRAFAAQPGENTLYLKSHDEVTYGRILGVVDAARSAGVRRLGLVVEPPHPR